MFRLTLIAAMFFAATLNAATIRFDWVDEPTINGKPPVTGYVTVKAKGPSIPGRGYVPVEDVVDYEINYNGHTIRMGDKDSYLTAENQGHGNSFLIVKGKLLLQGEVGSRIKFRKRMPDRNPPYAWSLTIEKAGVFNRATKGYDVDYYVHLGDKVTDEELHRDAVPNDLGLGFHGVLIGDNPRVVPDVQPTPVDPPVVPPSPVDPVTPVDDWNVTQLRARRSQLILELYRVQQQLDQLE